MHFWIDKREVQSYRPPRSHTHLYFGHNRRRLSVDPFQVRRFPRPRSSSVPAAGRWRAPLSQQRTTTRRINTNSSAQAPPELIIRRMDSSPRRPQMTPQSSTSTPPEDLHGDPIPKSHHCYSCNGNNHGLLLVFLLFSWMFFIVICSTHFSFITDLLFICIALLLFFTGVTCLRRQTNEYLLRTYNRHIQSRARDDPEEAMGSESPSDVEDGHWPTASTTQVPVEHPSDPNRAGTDQSPRPPPHNCLFSHPHHHHHPGQGQMSWGGSIHVGPGRGCPFSHHYQHQYPTSTIAKHSRRRPPPYHVALHLPIPPSSSNQGRPCQRHPPEPVRPVHAGFKVNSSSTSTGEKVHENSRRETPPPTYDEFMN